MQTHSGISAPSAQVASLATDNDSRREELPAPSDKVIGKLIGRLAKRYATDALPAEDLLQEAWLVVLTLRERGEEPEDLSTLAGVIRNRLQWATEREWAFQPESLDSECTDGGNAGLTGHEILGVPPRQEDALSLMMTLSDIARLPEETQEIIFMRADGCSFEEIATHLYKEVGAVKMALQRAREFLRQSEGA